MLGAYEALSSSCVGPGTRHLWLSESTTDLIQLRFIHWHYGALEIKTAEMDAFLATTASVNLAHF